MSLPVLPLRLLLLLCLHTRVGCSPAASFHLDVCTSALEAACPQTSKGNNATIQCDLCAGQHQQKLRAASCSAAAIQSWCTDAAPPVVKMISVDASTAGATPMRFTYGTDRGPQCQGVPPFTAYNGKHPQDDGADTSEALHSMGASVIRTHGSGELDWEKLFPHPNLDVRTDDPANYRFDAGDAWLHRVVDKGFEPYFRLGAGEFTVGAGLPPPGKPYNMTALVDVFLHIVMHYQEGWGGGNWTGQHGLRYFEIFNEPDSSCSWHAHPGCGQFWNRTADDFYDLFDGIARAVKQYDPTLIVGGPGAALADEGGPNSPWPAPVPNPFSFGLIDALATRKTPIDFFSWHFYTDNAALLSTIAEAMRGKLDSVGLHGVDQHVTEWFTGMLNPSENGVGDAAAVASILTRMIWANISLATLYPDCDGGQGQTHDTGWGLFDQESRPGKVTWRPLTHAFAAFGELAQTAVTLLPVTVVGSHEATYTALAGRGAAGQIRGLISSQVSTATVANVSITGLSQGTWRWSVSSIDAMHVTEPAIVAGGVETIQGGTLTVVFSLVAPAVALLRVDQV